MVRRPPLLLTLLHFPINVYNEKQLLLHILAVNLFHRAHGGESVYALDQYHQHILQEYYYQIFDLTIFVSLISIPLHH